MAQQGIHSTITQVLNSETGRISGAGGMLGAIITGYRYFPLKDTIDFNVDANTGIPNTITMLVLDKVNTVSTLPNRVDPNNVENKSYTIDMYAGVLVDAAAIADLTDGTAIDFANATIVYIPAQYVTNVVSMPNVDCCTPPEDTTISLSLTPASQSIGSFNARDTDPSTISPTRTYTLQYQNLTEQVIIDMNTGSTTNDAQWQWKKASDSTWLDSETNPIFFSLSELVNGGGYLDIQVRFIGEVFIGTPIGSAQGTFVFQASGESGTLTSSATATITFTNFGFEPPV